MRSVEHADRQIAYIHTYMDRRPARKTDKQTNLHTSMQHAYTCAYIHARILCTHTAQTHMHTDMLSYLLTCRFLWMYTGKYVRVLACMDGWLDGCIDLCMQVSVCVCVYVFMSLHTYIHKYVYALVQVACVHMHTFTYVCKSQSAHYTHMRRAATSAGPQLAKTLLQNPKPKTTCCN